jgi:hypothetical protein
MRVSALLVSYIGLGLGYLSGLLGVGGGIVTLQGTVETIEYSNRVVTIRGTGGGLVTLDVPTSVTRFDAIKVGDTVTATYDDRVTARIKPTGEPAVDSLTSTGAVSNPGPLPSGWTGSTRTVTVTIKSVDATTRTVSFEGPQGRLYVRRLAETVAQSLIPQITPGTRVDVTWNYNVTIQVTSGSTASTGFQQHWMLGLTVGVDNQFSGKMMTEDTGTLNGVPIALDETTFDETYGRIAMFRVGLARRITPRMEVEGTFIYSSSASQTVTIGRVGTAPNAVPVNADFTDYSYWGLEVGQRFFFTRVRFTPFVGYNVGINRYKTIDTVLTAPASATEPAISRSGEWFDESWAFSFAPTTGFLVGVGPVEAIAQLDFRFVGELSDVVPLADAGLRDVNQDSGRWSIPFTFGVRFRF